MGETLLEYESLIWKKIQKEKRKQGKVETQYPSTCSKYLYIKSFGFEGLKMKWRELQMMMIMENTKILFDNAEIDKYKTGGK